MDSGDNRDVVIVVGKNNISQTNQFVLLVSKERASSDLSSRIEIGKRLLQQPLDIKHFFDGTQQEYYKWDVYNSKLLLKLFAESTVSAEYASIQAYEGYVFSHLKEDATYFKETVQERVTMLESIVEQLDLYSEPHSEEIHMNDPSMNNQQLSKEVFIVHGHDESAKQAVARLIEKVGLEAIILHEKPNKGRTIIKKFEDYSNVGFAVILLTPDDVGAKKSESSNLKPRARQNVILELGFFLGKLGLEKVCALHKGDIELPSDYDGVIYIELDDKEAWKYKLGNELKAAGYNIDLNEIV